MKPCLASGRLAVFLQLDCGLHCTCYLEQCVDPLVNECQHPGVFLRTRSVQVTNLSFPAPNSGVTSHSKSFNKNSNTQLLNKYPNVMSYASTFSVSPTLALVHSRNEFSPNRTSRGDVRNDTQWVTISAPVDPAYLIASFTSYAINSNA